MKVIGIIIGVLVMLFVLQKVGYWLSIRLMAAIYAAKVSLTYGEKLSRSVHYKNEFYRCIDENYKKLDFMMALDSIVASFVTIWVTGITMILFGVAIAVIVRQMMTPDLELLRVYLLLLTLILEVVAVIMNILRIIREVKRIIKAYREVVFKEFIKADAAGETRKAEMELLMR